MGFSISDQVFRSKAQLRKYVRELLIKNVNKKISLGQTDYNFLMELVNRHPERDIKIGSGVRYFISRYNSMGRIELFIKRTDKTEIDISWVYCAEGWSNKPPKALLNSAFRNALNKQMNVYRENHPCCEGCKSTHELEVHHVIEFNEMVKSFIKDKKVKYVPTSFDDADNHSAKFKECDNDFEMKWRRYHKKHAQLKMLCHLCHSVVTGCKSSNDICLFD
jgi:hypothetical protein